MKKRIDKKKGKKGRKEGRKEERIFTKALDGQRYLLMKMEEIGASRFVGWLQRAPQTVSASKKKFCQTIQATLHCRVYNPLCPSIGLV